MKTPNKRIKIVRSRSLGRRYRGAPYAARYVYKSMSTWKPISEQDLYGLIETSEWSMNDTQKSFWDIIKLNKPEKWSQHPLGDEGNGFWVVAIYGNKCLYYNDIEEGFNESTFKVWGEIEEYFSNQIELHEFIGSIMEYRLNVT